MWLVVNKSKGNEKNWFHLNPPSVNDQVEYSLVINVKILLGIPHGLLKTTCLHSKHYSSQFHS